MPVVRLREHVIRTQVREGKNRISNANAASMPGEDPKVDSEEAELEELKLCHSG